MSETQLPRNMFGLSDVRCRREAGLTLDCPREASCEFILVVILSAAAKRSEYHCILQSELEQIKGEEGGTALLTLPAVPRLSLRSTQWGGWMGISEQLLSALHLQQKNQVKL